MIKLPPRAEPSPSGLSARSSQEADQEVTLPADWPHLHDLDPPWQFVTVVTHVQAGEPFEWEFWLYHPLLGLIRTFAVTGGLSEKVPK